MTIKDLKEKIESLPDDMMVLVDGYECDLDDVSLTNTLRVETTNETAYYYGNWKRTDEGVEAFLLSR